MNHYDSLHQQYLVTWYQSAIGQKLSNILDKKIPQYIENIFGYYVLQLGSIDKNYLQYSRISHHFFVDILREKQNHIIADYHNLPFAKNNIDLLIALHILETNNQAEKILEEIQRVLISEGYTLIISFNALNPFLDKKLAKKDFNYFKTLEKIKSMGMQIIKQEAIFFHSKVINKICTQLCPLFGGVYIILAKKKVIPVQIIKPKWIIKTGVTELAK